MMLSPRKSVCRERMMGMPPHTEASKLKLTWESYQMNVFLAVFGATHIRVNSEKGGELSEVSGDESFVGSDHYKEHDKATLMLPK
jgi:hypothetical protein